MLTGKMFRDGVISASNNISNSRKAVDALNIFPVPDGDTGTNMSMTIGAAAKEMAVLPDDCSLSEAASKCASALLRGARGNSGVILSLIFRGFAKGFKELDTAQGKDVARAFELGVKAAYKAVMKPTEGTILTVVRKASEAASELAKTVDDPMEVAFAALMAAKEALAETPEQLPVLKQAGVVDAGGQGLVLIFEGFHSVFANGALVQPVEAPQELPKDESKSTVANASDDIEFGYCSEFLIEKAKDAKEKDPLKLRAFLESIGDCVVVVDDTDIIKVHVHSNEPGNVIQAALKYGQLINIKIDNMRYQHRNAQEGAGESAKAPEPASPVNSYGFVAVCAGQGLTELFKDIGADVVVSGGQTMNPSTDDILNAVMATPAKTVFVLPNNKNIIMAAEQAARLTQGRTVKVLQTKTIPQGISAMLMFDEEASADENELAMTQAAEGVSTALVTFAARDSEVEGVPVKQGEIMGLCNGKIRYVGSGKVDIAFKSASRLIKRSDCSIVTIIFGEDSTEEEAEELKRRLEEKFGDIEFSVVNGGQPIYYFIISVE
ncbi:MAG TPA: DAK2 domain-containing protein [Candidatus Eubacterium faecipullorum]|uniref:DAK2 domain-containing protein n=1 Tax=Candidatus Eubacterium faecipullorum TaxID=2838571 RepID=A0A9D1UHG0_9FIRM|nr:DAK2 domain-containing protein [Candidatus Eubacterium faecipullorum]